jgi:2'-5' RNA ligase
MTNEEATFKRIFVGIPIPELLTRKISGLRFKIPELETLKWDALHLTLRFLGNVKRAEIPLLLTKAASLNYPSFSLSLRGIGSFGGRNPRVLWVGVEESAELSQVKLSLDELINPFAEKPPEERYVPHITLKRLRNSPSQKLIAALSTYKGEEFGGFKVESFTVFESVLEATGAKHIPLKVVPLT